MYYFPNRLMNDSRQQQTKPMEFIDYVAQPPRAQFEAPEHVVVGWIKISHEVQDTQ